MVLRSGGGGTVMRRDARYFLRRGSVGIRLRFADHVHNAAAKAFRDLPGRYVAEHLYGLFLAYQRQLLPHLNVRWQLVLVPADLLDQLLHRLRQRYMHRRIRH